MRSLISKIYSYLNQLGVKKLCVKNHSTIALILMFNLILPIQAFEDCIITTKGKLTDISIEDNSIVDICPLITIMNDKNTLMLTPLKEGKTRFCVLKNGREKVLFNIEISEKKTKIDTVNGFDILTLDTPHIYEFELDEPPLLKEVK